MNFNKWYFIPFIMLATVSQTALSQHQEVGEKPALWKSNESELPDTNVLLYAFKSGSFQGHLRYFFSATDNQGDLTDYYANAAGGGIRYETGKFRGFQFGVSGFFVFNIGSSDLLRRDSLTGQANRYEIGLFDIENPTNKKDIDRLEEFFLKYSIGKSNIKFGRQLINTPFINLQDGRMRPTGVEGIWFEMNEIRNLKLEGGWIYAVSPRSTVSWYNTAASVGLYSSGVHSSGVRSDYDGNLTSQGVYSLGIKYQPLKWMGIKIWDLYFENILHSALVQMDISKEVSTESSWVAGLQYIRQDVVGDGGNIDPLKAYADRNAFATVYGARLGMKHKRLNFLMNYTRITDDGRYLMPREWGRDPFFTFMPRERNEGFGDVHAFTSSLSFDFPDQHVKTTFTGGYFQLPDIKNYRLNKYGMPSYLQFNMDVRHVFQGMLKGLDAQLLAVAKVNQGELYNDPRSEFNKVNMELYNLVLNYHF